MRISAERSSPDYHPAASQGTVTLNGAKLTNCVHADDATGTVIVVDVHGQRWTRRGIVRLSFPEECASLGIPEKYIVRIKPGVRGLVIAR